MHVFVREGWIALCLLVSVGGWVAFLAVRHEMKRLRAEMDVLQKHALANPWTHLRSNPMHQRNDEITGRAPRGQTSSQGETL